MDVELLKTWGALGATLFIVVLVLRKSVNTNSSALDNIAAMLKLEIRSQKRYAQQFITFQQALERHTEADRTDTQEQVTALNAHTAALTANIKTLADIQAALLTQLTSAITEMRGAQTSIVQAVNESEGRTGVALTGVQTELTTQHTGQGEALEKAVTEIKKEISGEIQTNGVETRNMFEPVMKYLEAIQKTLDGMRDDITGLKGLRTEVAALKVSVNALVPKLPPADPAPVVPPKAEKTDG